MAAPTDITNPFKAIPSAPTVLHTTVVVDTQLLDRVALTPNRLRTDNAPRDALDSTVISVVPVLGVLVLIALDGSGESAVIARVAVIIDEDPIEAETSTCIDDDAAATFTTIAVNDVHITRSAFDPPVRVLDDADEMPPPTIVIDSAPVLAKLVDITTLTDAIALADPSIVTALVNVPLPIDITTPPANCPIAVAEAVFDKILVVDVHCLHCPLLRPMRTLSDRLEPPFIIITVTTVLPVIATLLDLIFDTTTLSNDIPRVTVLVSSMPTLTIT